MDLLNREGTDPWREATDEPIPEHEMNRSPIRRLIVKP